MCVFLLCRAVLDQEGLEPAHDSHDLIDRSIVNRVLDSKLSFTQFEAEETGLTTKQTPT